MSTAAVFILKIVRRGGEKNQRNAIAEALSRVAHNLRNSSDFEIIRDREGAEIGWCRFGAAAAEDHATSKERIER